MSSELHDCVRRSLNRYFRDLDGNKLSVFCVG